MIKIAVKKSVVLKKKAIEALFEKSKHQAEVVAGLYKMVFPDWDDIEEVDGWPEISHEAGLFITGLFMEFDRKHHPKAFNGGLWLNCGFSSLSQREKGWEVDVSKVKVIYKKPAAANQI